MTDDLHAAPATPDAFGRRYWRATPAADRALAPIDGPPGDGEFRLLADNLPTLCWLARADGYIVWYNRRCLDYCGVSAEVLEGWGWEGVQDPAEFPHIRAAWIKAIQAGEAFEMLISLRGADGVFRPFLTRIAPLRDASGQVARWFGVNIEVGAQMHAESALTASEAKFDALTDAMPQIVWSTRPDGSHDYYNARWYEFTGVSPGAAADAEWDGTFHPDDRARARALWQRSLKTGQPYEIEYRLRHHSGAHRWTLCRALPVRDADGRITRWIGACTDIHDAKLAAERSELFSRELSHRIKNIFAVIGGLIGMTARREPAIKPYAKALSERIAALARAHEFARPHSEESRPATAEGSLLGLLHELLSPYPAMKEGRLRITGDDARIDDRGATPIALVVHELATNAAKYGALSTDEGSVEITCRSDGAQLTLAWRERGGPPVVGVPTREGFGTRLAALSVEHQLGGRLSRVWAPEGLELELEVKLSRLSRDEPLASDLAAPAQPAD